jgi:Zn-dependent M28 family amino/carboxypeptidase
VKRSCLAIAAAIAVSTAAAAADGSAWWKHVEFLADDALQGRDTGSPGHKRAAAYVADEFRKSGLEPAGTDGFLQPIAFRTRAIDEAHSSLALVRDGRTTPLTLGEHANFRVAVDPAPSVDAPLVFAGHGLSVPEQGINDLDGLNLRGAIVVYLATTPRSLPGALQAHFGAATERWRALGAAGAVGTITIANPRTTETPWAQTAAARLLPAMSLADPALDEYAGAQVAITMNPAHANLLFEGSGHTFDEVIALETAGRPLPRFALPARVSATIAVTRTQVESQNVAGILRGADPERRNEFVIVSAHLDHVGVGAPVNGDAIYNGAMDNASGIAAILEIAARLHAARERPARSLLFLAVTAEEKGELGSRYFAAHPTVPARALVADVNTDMFLPLFPLKELMVLGLDESDLGGDIRAVAGAMHLQVQADPEPQRNRFIRSDQYSFIRAGIPALAMKVGFELNTPEAAIAQKWTTERYHLPSDDLNQPVDRNAADTYIEVVRRLAVRISNRTTRPRWNESSFFARFNR